MPKALTVRSVEQFKADQEKRQEIPDAILTGLYLVIQPQPSTAKSWAVRYRHGGKPRKLTLGSYPALGLGEARAAAKSALQIVAKGGDPASQKKVARLDAAEGRDLVETVIAEFMERHAKVKRSRDEIQRMFDHDVLPKWRGRRIQDITRRDVIELLDGLVDRGVGTMTNRVFSIIRKLFNWALSRDVVAASPCGGMRAPVAEVSRDRILSDDEIRWMWRGADQLGYPFGPLFKLLLVTAQRESEVAGLSANEVNIRDRLWTLPSERAKNGRANEVALSDAAVAIIEGLPRIAGKAQLLFTTTGETPVSGFSRAKRNLDEAIIALARDEASERGDEPNEVEIAHWQLHDLRRTATSVMAKLGQPPHVVDAILNHKSGTIRGVAAVYNRYSYAEEKRRALDAWGRYLTALVDERPARNVVILDRARA